MKVVKYSHSGIRQIGVTLVELMVAIAIGLIITVAVIEFYLQSLRSQTAQVDVVMVNENMRFAFDLISREIRKSGFSNVWQGGVTAGGNFCSTGTSQLLGLNDPATIDTSSATLVGTATTIYSSYSNGGNSSSNDVLQVKYYGEDTAGTSPIYDCQGFPVNAGVMVKDTLFVAADPANNNEPTLYCHSSNPNSGQTALPVVPGIESLQLLYGEDANADGIIDRYVPWQIVTNTDNVTSIKVSIVARGTSVSNVSAPTTPMTHFSSSYPAVANGDSSAIFPYPGVNVPSDNRLRKMLSTEVAFRNYRWCQ